MPRTSFRMSATAMDEKLILYDLEPSKCGQKNIYQKIARFFFKSQSWFFSTIKPKYVCLALNGQNGPKISSISYWQNFKIPNF